MIPEFGIIFLILAMVNSLLVFILPHPNVKQLRSHVMIQVGFVALTMSCLWIAIFTNDYSVHYVAFHSYSQLPWYYKLSSLWGGHEGSLLLWLFIQQIYHYLLLNKLTRTPISSKHTIVANKVMHLYSLALLAIICFTSNPFLRDISSVPIDGADLNPMLQDFALIIHPPILYSGYVGTSSLFALAIAFLWHGYKSEMLEIFQHFTYLCWGFLCIGITLGSWWAYYELGWGGWWFWDPAENVALLPCLCLTALIHAQYATKMNYLWWRWSVLLAMSAFLLSIFGTFLIRSGVVSSIHSFALDFAKAQAFISVIVLFSIIAIYSFWKNRSKNKNMKFKFRSVKEIYLAVVNLVLLVALLTILLGTVYPIFTKLVFGYEVTVGFPYFNTVFVSLMLPLLLLAPYSKGLNNHRQQLLHFLISVVISLIIVQHFGQIKLLPLVGVTSSVYILISEIFSVYNLKRTLAHSGLALVVIAVSIVSNYEKELEVRMQQGERYEINGVSVGLDNVKVDARANHVAYISTVNVNSGAEISEIYPEKRYYFSSNNATTEMALFVTPFYDIYVAMSEKRGDSWIFRIAYKPMVRWMWLGGIIMMMAAVVAVFRRKNA
ncbi:MAG: heme lyase CcmF/NrfE family subunit [Francisellaceae bacterium]|nr:heme lyase CcmF/NrfE family subunit [Francisellaceae bacterium]